jgi:hypothetical protein
MANKTRPEGDQYFPEFWAANRVIGELELAAIKAEKIIGQLTNAQIKSLESGKITGQLTNEQIKEIEAAKIAGQLTNAQIKELEAAKIVGKIVNAQIESIQAVKVTGLLTNAQIESIAAFKVTGLLTNAQIESIAAFKVTGLITNAQLEAIAATKITGLITTAQIQEIEAAKVAGQLTNEQLKEIEAVKVTFKQTRTNYVTQPDFETGGTGMWQPYSAGKSAIEIVATEAKFGTHSLRVHPAEAGGGAQTAIVLGITPSKTYTSSLWVKGPIGSKIRFLFREITEANATVGTTETQPTFTGEWQQISLTRAFGATGVRFQMFFIEIGGPFEFFLDGVLVEQATKAGTFFPTLEQIEANEATYLGEAGGSQSIYKPLGLPVTGELVGQIVETQIGPEAISTPKLKALAITAEKLAAESVIAGKIAASAVTAEKIAALAVTAGKLAAESVEAGKIAVGAVTAEKVAALAITAEKLAAESVIAGKIAVGAITAEKVAALAITAEKLAAESVEAGKIKAEAVTTAKIQALAITAVKLAAESVEAGKIQAEAVTTAKIQALAITAAKIAAETIEAANIKAEAITVNKLGALSVTAAKLAVGAVEANKILANAVTAEKILAESVTAVKIAAGAISAEKIAAGAVTAGKIAVEELSAITAHLGKIETGTLETVTIKAATIEMKVETAKTAVNAIRWFEGATEGGAVQVNTVGGIKNYLMVIESVGALKTATLELWSRRKTAGEGAILAKVEAKVAAGGTCIIDEEEKSQFLQLGGLPAKKKITTGKTELEWPGATKFTTAKEIEHGLGIEPAQVIATAFNNVSITVACTVKTATKITLRAGNWAGEPAAGEKVTVHWIAIG